MTSSTLWPHLFLTLCIAPIGSGCARRDLDGGGNSTTYGDVRVVVRLREPIPAAPVVFPDKDQAHCGNSYSDTSLEGADSSIKGCAVWIASASSYAPPEPRDVHLSIERCQFVPRVQSATVGARLLTDTSDPITHNPHAWIGNTSIFNMALASDGVASFGRTLKRPGIYRIDCDTHQWMKAYVVVLDHTAHAITDAAGVATISHVPSGPQVVEIWHEMLGSATRPVRVLPNAETQVEFTYPLSDQRPAPLKPPYAR